MLGRSSQVDMMVGPVTRRRNKGGREPLDSGSTLEEARRWVPLADKQPAAPGRSQGTSLRFPVEPHDAGPRFGSLAAQQTSLRAPVWSRAEATRARRRCGEADSQRRPRSLTTLLLEAEPQATRLTVVTAGYF